MPIKWVRLLKKSFTNPVLQYIEALLFTLVVVYFVDRQLQLAGVVAIAVVFIGLRIMYLAYLSRSREPRLIRYERVIRTSQIKNEEGDAELSWTFIGKNLGDAPILSLRHTLRHPGQEMEEANIKSCVDGSPIRTTVRSTKLISETGKVAWEVLIMVNLQMSPIKPKRVFVWSLTVSLKGAYGDAFPKADGSQGEDEVYYTVHTPTKELVQRVLACKGYVATPVLREGIPSTTVRDWNGNMDPDEIKRVSERGCPETEANGFVWRVKKPFTTYTYQALFRCVSS